MSRIPFIALTFLIIGLAVVWRDGGAAADATPVAQAAHPLVGSWVVTDPQQYTDAPEFLVTFFADGNALVTDGLGRTYQGAWEPRNERAGRWAVVHLGRPGTADPGATFFGFAVVDASGDRFVSSESTYYPDERKQRGERIAVDGRIGDVS